jgi:dTDP-glucose 4,6-dehydratase
MSDKGFKRICVTGGAGFIASHLADHFLRAYPDAEVVVVDNLSYAGRLEYMADASRSGRLCFLRADICDEDAMRAALRGVDLVVHAAAESHVDRSYRNLEPFLQTNIAGTVSLLKAAVENRVRLFFHVSTDEVYGESADRDFSDEQKLQPTNPYAASKASAEMFVHCYATSYGLATRISRANNIYGTRQYPEKLIPKLICDALRGEVFEVHGTGSSIRSFLSVADYASAVQAIIDTGEDGEIYNVPALREYSVMDVVDLVGAEMGIPVDRLVRLGVDRPHNDCRYGVCGQKLLDLGWRPARRLEQDLPAIVAWYRENLHLYYDGVRPGAGLRAEGSPGIPLTA